MEERARRSRWPRRLAWLLAAALVAVNAAAFMQAGSMTRWAEGDERTDEPEALGPLERLRVIFTGVSLPRPVDALTPLAFGVEAETVEIPGGHGGSALAGWYLAAPDEELVAVLFHGWAASKATLLPHALALQELGASVLLVDFHGSGDSEGTGTSLGIHEADDVVAAVDWVRSTRPWAEVLLYGQSMGGAAVLRAVALEGLEPDGIALDSTYGRLLATVKARFHRMGLPATPLAELLVFWGGVRLGASGFEQLPAEFARSVRCPTLVLHAEDDASISTESARELFAALGGWKRFSEYPGSQHGGLMRADPDRWRRDLAELLRVVESGEGQLAEPGAPGQRGE